MTVTVNRNRKIYGYTDNFKTANLQAYFHLAELMLLSEGNRYKVHVNCSREDTVASVTSASARPANAFLKT